MISVVLAWLAVSAAMTMAWSLAGRAGVFDSPPPPPVADAVVEWHEDVTVMDDGYPESDGDAEGQYGDLR
jgi:hypothetical protein